MSNKQSVDFVTSGSYNREEIVVGGIQLTASVEAEIAAIATAIAGDATKDTMYSWIRCKVWILNSAAEFMCYEWALIKCASGDALQDLNDEAAVEKLQKEGRILARDIHARGPYQSGVKPIAFEKFKVHLNAGEELRLVYRPIAGTAGATCAIEGLIEWRQVGA